METNQQNQQKGPGAPQASENTEVEDSSNVEMAGGESNGGDTASAFLGSGRVMRSPVLNQTTTSSQQLGESGVVTPKAGGSSVLNFAGGGGVQLEKTALQEVRRRVNELFDFIKDKNNVHTKIKQMVTGVKAAMTAAEREYSALKVTRTSLKVRAERAENALQAKLEEEALREKEPKTPPGPSTKRDRETPGEQEDAKKHKKGSGGDSPDPAKEPKPDPGKEEGWETAKRRKRKKTEKQNEDAQKPKLRRERNRGEALVVEVKEGLSYAEERPRGQELSL